MTHAKRRRKQSDRDWVTAKMLRWILAAILQSRLAANDYHFGWRHQNLIFAVIMAGVAYRFGVPYTPTVIGEVVGGGPAWQAGLQPGDKLLQVGNMTSKNSMHASMTFVWKWLCMAKTKVVSRSR